MDTWTSKNFLNVLNDRSLGHMPGSVYQELSSSLEQGFEVASNVGFRVGLALGDEVDGWFPLDFPEGLVVTRAGPNPFQALLGWHQDDGVTVDGGKVGHLPLHVEENAQQSAIEGTNDGCSRRCQNSCRSLRVQTLSK